VSSRLQTPVVFLLGCAVSFVLWRFWTARCNEACPENIALLMQLTVLVLPWLLAVIAAALLASSLAMVTRRRLAGALLAAIIVYLVILTLSASPLPDLTQRSMP
jgi:cytochrome bd-type quinol oxidase subunit 2